MSAAAQIAIGAVAGFLLGLAHFLSLAANAELYLARRARAAIALHVARALFTLALLGALAWIGAAALIAGVLGLTVARSIVLRRAKAKEGR